MHEKNCFITLTYSDEHLKSPKLVYEDWQNFMKKLRKLQNDPMRVMVVGEYGEKNKRPHWHALVFNWQPSDMRYYRRNDRGDELYTSATLDSLWGRNDALKRPNEVGSVTFQSAGYVARYNAKKLVHGKDGEHDFTPKFEPSRKYAIGRSWLEKNWPDAFHLGQIALKDGNTCGIPRYYERWLNENHPAEFRRYVTEVKTKKWLFGYEKSEKEKIQLLAQLEERRAQGKHWLHPPSKQDVMRAIQKQRFQMLQDHLKL